MSNPSRPHWQPQGPAGRCVINGKQLGWTNCTPTSTGMGIDKSTLGRKRPTGCDIRRLTGDTTGGTTMRQCASAASHYGVDVAVHAGSGVATDEQVASWLRHGRGVVVQGNTQALLSHPAIKSTGGPVNHATWFNEVRGGTIYVPDEVLVYDPAADGRQSSWGRAAQGPDWWPWEIAMNFMAALRPWGDNDPRRLGPNKVYCGVFPDTEPHVHLRYNGSVRTSPFPKPMIVRSPTAGHRVNVRKGPSKSYGVATTLPSGAHWTAYQQNSKGALLAGSRLWYGDHSGTRWIHSSGLIVPRATPLISADFEMPLEDDEEIVDGILQMEDPGDTVDAVVALGEDALPDDVRDGDISQFE